MKQIDDLLININNLLKQGNASSRDVAFPYYETAEIRFNRATKILSETMLTYESEEELKKALGYWSILRAIKATIDSSKRIS